MTIRNYRLDPEEQEIEDAFEAGLLRSVPNVEEERQKLIRAAKAFNRNKIHRINIRLSEPDFRKAEEYSEREGIPNATLLSSILHKFFAGQLVEQR